MPGAEPRVSRRSLRRVRVLGPARPATGLVLALLLTLALSACGSDDDVPPGPDDGPSSEATGPLAESDLWLSFEDSRTAFDGTVEYPDAVGGDVLARVVTSAGGTVTEVEGPDGEGNAVEFPPLCADPEDCPRAMLEIDSDPLLDPGESDFSFGATVWLAPDQTTSGSNIVQKGRFGTDGGQWKLQVDTEEGQPSCVIRSGEDVHRVRSEVSIADSAWHQVTCVRDARGIGIVVDGEERRAAGETGTVANEWPIRIGSPGVGEDDDQFHGRVDDVFLTIGQD